MCFRATCGVVGHVAAFGIPEPVQHAVNKVSASIYENAATGSAAIGDEARHWRPAANRSFLVMESMHRTEKLFVQELLQEQHFIAESCGVSDSEKFSGSFGCCADCLSIFGGCREWLLDQAVLAGTKAGGSDVAVRVIR